MADVFTKERRSELIERIRSRGNKATELAMVVVFRRCKTTDWRRRRMCSPGGTDDEQHRPEGGAVVQAGGSHGE